MTIEQFVTNSDVYTVDAHYYKPRLAAIHLILSNSRVAIIDTGTQHSVDNIESALHQLSLDFDAVDLVILTHIHLDHAGGASALMQRCPNAKLVVHAKGARHMVEPEKLIAGSKAVYGEEEFKRLYGTISPIDESRIVVPDDGASLDVGSRELVFIDTPGHANHHLSVFDTLTLSVFTGDTLGVAYTDLQDGDKRFVMPTTTPVQFNPEALHNSINRVMALEPEWLYVTHYSAVQPHISITVGLHQQIDDFVELTEKYANKDEELFTTNLGEALLDYLLARCQQTVPSIDEKTAREWITLDANLNAQGLVHWWNYRR